jgi:hypothetical protein
VDTKVDAELKRQLAAAGEGENVAAVIRLRAPTSGDLSPTPEQTDRIVESLLERTCRRVTASPDYNVFRNLGYFVVSAPPDFIRTLIGEPEVASAVPNRRPAEENESSD